MTTREDAAFALVHAHWEWVDVRNLENETLGSPATPTGEALFEVVQTMRTIGIAPDEVLRAIRRWLVENDELTLQMGQYWLVLWENAVEDVLVGHVQ